MEQPHIDDLARRLAASLPEAARTLRADVENNFRAVLQATLSRLDVTTRSEFDVQSKVLERARAQITQLEARIAALEARQEPPQPASPPAHD